MCEKNRCLEYTEVFELICEGIEKNIENGQFKVEWSLGVLIILDCCHGGAMIEHVKRKSSDSYKRLMEVARKGSGIALSIWTASRKDQISRGNVF